jgi:hypothetical protein
LTFASSLAAAIENKFGTTVKLIEGHNGVYNVAVNGNLIFTNQGKCSERPTEEQIIEEIQKQLTLHHTENPNEKRRILKIEFMYIDLSMCTRCQRTKLNLEEAVAEVAQVLKATGVDISVRKIHVQSEEQARELGFVISPTIRIDGKDIELDVKENLCETCSDLCGEGVECRVWTYQGKEYTEPPKGMIIDAILREIYGGSKEITETIPVIEKVPENLKKFFAAKRSKVGNNASKFVNICCNPYSNDS